MHWRRKCQPTPVFLPGESQGRGSLVGCRLWGRTESDMIEGDLAVAAYANNLISISQNLTISEFLGLIALRLVHNAWFTAGVQSVLPCPPQKLCISTLPVPAPLPQAHGLSHSSLRVLTQPG